MMDAKIVLIAGCILSGAAASSAGEPPACPSISTTASRKLIRDACRDLRSVLARVPGTTVRMNTGPFLDERYDCARQGCVVTLKGRFSTLGEQETPDSWLGDYLERKGWAPTLSHGADGPDGTSYALHQPGALCIVQGRWNHWDDEDGGHTEDWFQTIVSCGGAERQPPHEP